MMGYPLFFLQEGVHSNKLKQTNLKWSMMENLMLITLLLYCATCLIWLDFIRPKQAKGKQATSISISSDLLTLCGDNFILSHGKSTKYIIITDTKTAQ